MARFLTNPLAVALTVFVVLAVVAARAGFGDDHGRCALAGARRVADWWRLHLESWHPLGTGTDVPAPAYVLPLRPRSARSCGGSTGAVVSALMVLAVPLAPWGAWRLLRVVGRLADPRGLPRWLLAWGAATYALVPVTSGAWGEGRFGTVALGRAAALARARRARLRRPRARPPLARRVAHRAAARPGRRVRARASGCSPCCAAAVVLGVGFAIVPRLLRDRTAGGRRSPPWRWCRCCWRPVDPAAGHRAGEGLLLEAGRLPGDRVDVTGLLTGRLGDVGAPWWLGALLGLLAVLALVPALDPGAGDGLLAGRARGGGRGRRAGARSPCDLPGRRGPGRASGFFVVVLQGVAVVAAALGAEAWLRPPADAEHPGWQRASRACSRWWPRSCRWAAWPGGGRGRRRLRRDVGGAVPAYMAQSSLLGAEHGVLVVRGSVEEGSPTGYAARTG